jgi:hypothetical protein
MQTISDAVETFRSARSKMTGDDDSIEQVDRALQALLATPSSTVRDFGLKLSALVSEYGNEWQPRHCAALMADIGILSR